MAAFSLVSISDYLALSRFTAMCNFDPITTHDLTESRRPRPIPRNLYYTSQNNSSDDKLAEANMLILMLVTSSSSVHRMVEELLTEYS